MDEMLHLRCRAGLRGAGGAGGEGGEAVTDITREQIEELENRHFGVKDAWGRVNMHEESEDNAERLSEEFVADLVSVLPSLLAAAKRAGELQEKCRQLEASRDRAVAEERERVAQILHWNSAERENLLEFIPEISYAELILAVLGGTPVKEFLQREIDCADRILPCLSDDLHPNGRCRCSGEGHCVWCRRTAASIALAEGYPTAEQLRAELERSE